MKTWNTFLLSILGNQQRVDQIQASVDLYMMYLDHIDVLRNNDEIIVPLLKRMR